MTNTASDEERCVENAVVDKTQANNLDGGSDAGDRDHLLAGKVKVIVEVGVGAPAAPLG